MVEVPKDKRREEHLDELRERLYARGAAETTRGRSNILSPDQKVSATSGWQAPPVVPPEPVSHAPVMVQKAQETFSHFGTMVSKKRKRFRTLIIAGGVIFFALALILSAALLLFGKNSISGSNISIDVRGPFAVGGGEELPLSISITNQNSVPIQAATLIIEYPQGTQSVAEPGKELFRDRKSIDRIGAGQVVNVDAKALVFGEENEEKEVKVSVEYRVEGSNATFYKDAPPLRFKINSSPVVLSIEAVDQISSGQEAEFELKIRSNSPTTLTNLLISAEYPDDFDFTTSSPKPAAGENSWLISELKPEEEQMITLSGMVVGNKDEVKVFNFTAGVPSERNELELASVFTAQSHEIKIEESFVNLSMRINGSTDENAVVNSGNAGSVSISFTNTLSYTIYDAKIEVELSGNALDKSRVFASGGFYNSSAGNIVWDKNTTGALSSIPPGGTRNVSFTVTPAVSTSRTPQISMELNVRGKRVATGNVPEQLIGAISRDIKVASVAQLTSQGLYSIGPFSNNGPVPPVAEEVTEYTVMFTVTNGSNSATDATVEATLPLYVTWLDRTNTSRGSFTYNASNRLITWKVGDLDAGKSESGAFQISFLPSVSQVGSIPALVTDQRFRATDRFTGTILRSTAPNVTTELELDPDRDAQDGRVKEN